MSKETRGGHKALVAARPRIPGPPGTPDVNDSWRLPQRLLGPRPPPPAAAHHQAPPPLASARTRGLLGGVVRSPAEARLSCPAGTTTPRKHRDRLRCSLPQAPPPWVFLQPPPLSTDCELVFSESQHLAAPSCAVLGCQRDFSHYSADEVVCFKFAEGGKGRRLKN